MRRLAQNRPSPAMVVAMIALFVSLGGAGYAALKVGSVGSKQLKKNAVTAAKIKKNSVTGAKVADSSLTGDDVADSSLTGADVKDASLAGADLSDGSVALGDLATNSVNGTKVVDRSLEGKDVAANTFLGASVTVQHFVATTELLDGGEISIDVHCLAGETALGGGARGDLTNSEVTIITSTRPIISTANSGAPASGGSFTGWRATVINPSGGTLASGIFPEVWVICSKAP